MAEIPGLPKPKVVPCYQEGCSGLMLVWCGLVGYVHTTYAELVRVFGEPTHPHASGDGKVLVQWTIRTAAGWANIYCWKLTEVPMGEHDWNVGAADVGVLAPIAQALGGVPCYGWRERSRQLYGF
jgi:hypothetical protein